MVLDLYRILQVEPHATAETIQAAYRRLARQYHPDLNPRPEAAEHMRSINSAYAVLSDPRRRAAYDAGRYLPRRIATATVRRPVTASGSATVRRSASPTVEANARANAPTTLQRRVDRVVAVLGVLLLLAIAFYTINVIPYQEQQWQADRSAAPVRSSTGSVSQQHGTAPIPQRVANDDALKSFPGTVLVAPQSLPPFSSLPVVRVDANGLGIARYAVYYGDWSQGGATITGLVGRGAFDSSMPSLPGCDAQAAYCVGPAPGQSSGANGFELFRPGDLVDDAPAVATHRVCCNGTFWSVAWYEPRANMSYSIDLSRALAMQFAGDTLNATNVDAARGVASLAKQLVRLP
jgi:DnaJ domain